MLLNMQSKSPIIILSLNAITLILPTFYVLENLLISWVMIKFEDVVNIHYEVFTFKVFQLFARWSQSISSYKNCFRICLCYINLFMRMKGIINEENFIWTWSSLSWKISTCVFKIPSCFEIQRHSIKSVL